MNIKTFFISILIVLVLLPLSTTSINISKDVDPLVDLELIVTVQTIRGLEDAFATYEDFFINLTIQDTTFTSLQWKTLPYVNNINWTIVYDIADDEEEDIVISLALYGSFSVILVMIQTKIRMNSIKSYHYPIT